MKNRIAIAVLATALSCLFASCTFTSPGQAKYQPITHSYSVSDPEFQRSLYGLLGEPLMGGNRVDTLQNGDQIFPSMLEAIRGAQQSIDFETYVYWEGSVGAEFTDALAERARQGVEVRVIIDWQGRDEYSSLYIKTLQDAGATVIEYHPLHWYNILGVDFRTHRKLLILDGKIGFTGGVGIGDQWLGHAQDEDHWRENHYRVTGPAVLQMQGTFAEHWLKSEGEVLDGKKFFPLVPDAGPMLVQMQKSSPYEGIWSTELLYRLAITAADHEIRIESPYFVPDDLTNNALIAAARRGVVVRIIVPGFTTDSPIVREVSRDGWQPLLEAGVRFYEYQPTMFHCKLMVVDDIWTSVGSTNFDNRSFHLNDEANLNVLDQSFAREQSSIFDEDLTHSKQITLSQWRRQPWYRRLAAKVMGELFGSQL